jgi:hypothetical protein
MSMTPEGKVKDKVKRLFKSMDVYYAMPATGGYGASGVPDFLVCLKGRFIGVECKAGKGKPTALQLKNLAEIEASGGISVIVNEDNLELFETAMRKYYHE